MHSRGKGKVRCTADITGIPYLQQDKSIHGGFEVVERENTATKIFANFKTYMRNEQNALWQVGALTIRDSELSQANMLQILTTHKNKLAQKINVQLASAM